MPEKQYHCNNPFMQLEEWVVDILVSNQLTKTDHRLFWYLFKLDRWGDRFVDLPSQSEIALHLEVRRETINQSQAKLQRLGLWDFQVTGWKARNLVAPKSNRVLEKSNRVLDKDHSQLEKSHSGLEKDHTMLEKSNTYILEPAPDMASSASQTIQTYSDFLNTLSDSERERFEKFVREEWKKETSRLGQPGKEVVSLERFLAKETDFKNWHQRFLASPTGRAAKQEAIAARYDWENDPRFDEWLPRAFYEGVAWVQENEVEREQRNAFLEWAQLTDPYKGRLY